MKYRLLNFCLKTFSKLPFRFLYAIADVIGLLLYYVVRYRRKVVRRNLTECFPDKGLCEIRQIEKRFYRFFADNIVETCKLATMSEATMRKRMIFVNIDEVNRRTREGRSVALFLGHYANWEWISSIPLYLDKDVIGAQIYHKLRNDAVNRIMLNMRSRMGAVSVDMHDTARYINRLASDGARSVIGFIADQSPRFKEVKYFIPFFHHETPVLVGTEKIVKHYDFDAWFVKPRRVRRGYYEVTFIRMNDDPEALPDFELTGIYYRMLEQMIEECPSLYLWSHNRFKHARCSENKPCPPALQSPEK